MFSQVLHIHTVCNNYKLSGTTWYHVGMSTFEQVIYIQGMGKKPAVQSDLPKLWLFSGLLVEHQPIDWAGDDYADRLSHIGGRLVELSERGSVSVVASSGGVKTMMSLFARYAEFLNRGVAINGKYQPFDLSEDPDFWQQYPNIAASSKAMQEDYEGMSSQEARPLFQRLLWLYSPDDAMIPSDSRPPGLDARELPVSGHVPGIEYALTAGRMAIATYLQDGIAPTSVYWNEQV